MAVIHRSNLFVTFTFATVMCFVLCILKAVRFASSVSDEKYLGNNEEIYFCTKHNWFCFWSIILYGVGLAASVLLVVAICIELRIFLIPWILYYFIFSVVQILMLIYRYYWSPHQVVEVAIHTACIVIGVVALVHGFQMIPHLKERNKYSTDSAFSVHSMPSSYSQA